MLDLLSFTGGSSLTTMVACVSSCDVALEETASTLDYAAVAKRVTNHVCMGAGQDSSQLDALLGSDRPI